MQAIPRHHSRTCAALCAATLLVVACGGGGSENDDSAAAAAPVATVDALDEAGAIESDAADSTQQALRYRRNGQATLGWTATSDSAVVGYRLYYGAASRTYDQTKGSGIAVGSSTAYTVTRLVSGKKYFFALTSFDAAGRESDYSNEATKQLP